MLIYHIGIYDTKKKKIDSFLFLPERRRDPKRMTKPFIDKWIRFLMGEKWWNKNWTRVSIARKRINI